MAAASKRTRQPGGTTAPLADRLLDAQVDSSLGELSGERLVANIARDVDDVLAVAGTLVVGRRRRRRAGEDRPCAGLVAQVAGSPLVADLVDPIADAIYDLTASDEYWLGDVIDRGSVSALIAKLLGMRTLHERLLERTTESPLVATVASKFVTKIIADFVQQNRARAEKLPGMSSLLSLGAGAASKVRSATDRHVDQFLGDAAGKSAQYALRRTNKVLLELADEAPLHDAALEVWDLHADEPISGLRAYLTGQDVRELAALVHELVADVTRHRVHRALLDACVDVFFERYGEYDVAALLAEARHRPRRPRRGPHRLRPAHHRGGKAWRGTGSADPQAARAVLSFGGSDGAVGGGACRLSDCAFGFGFSQGRGDGGSCCLGSVALPAGGSLGRKACCVRDSGEIRLASFTDFD